MRPTNIDTTSGGISLLKLSQNTALQWFGVFGLSVTLIGAVEPMLTLASWAKWIVTHYSALIHKFWTQVFSFIHIAFPKDIANTITASAFILLCGLTYVGVLRRKKGQFHSHLLSAILCIIVVYILLSKDIMSLSFFGRVFTGSGRQPIDSGVFSWWLVMFIELMMPMCAIMLMFTFPLSFDARKSWSLRLRDIILIITMIYFAMVWIFDWKLGIPVICCFLVSLVADPTKLTPKLMASLIILLSVLLFSYISLYSAQIRAIFVVPGQ